MNYASRWARLFAAVIDFFVLIVIWGILAAVGIFGPIGDAAESAESITTLSGDTVVVVVTALVYYFALTAAFGATLGKMALGMRVVGADGGKATTGAVAVREVIGRAGNYIVQVVLFVVLRSALSDGSASGLAGLVGGLVFLIVFLRILVDDHRQGWHDKIGGTFVVKAK